ncbi:hypothetical protein [Notoacmeibacter sp. MSK16QG-6]|uniref:hypothetical protein n=1 Tax=Notoacmeibacter sp. MSK16QG-6 TaxID=2957982 RepID=UPI00209E8D81|nr:hypothetical protein [Notoacmeibacter sp. MSK16QG-6]MCP1200612.1 hypothetical protein [Notoacmeibacter sp. MSK16QG-6]
MFELRSTPARYKSRTDRRAGAVAGMIDAQTEQVTQNASRHFDQYSAMADPDYFNSPVRRQTRRSGLFRRASREVSFDNEDNVHLTERRGSLETKLFIGSRPLSEDDCTRLNIDPSHAGKIEMALDVSDRHGYSQRTFLVDPNNPKDRTLYSLKQGDYNGRYSEEWQQDENGKFQEHSFRDGNYSRELGRENADGSRELYIVNGRKQELYRIEEDGRISPQMRSTSTFSKTISMVEGSGGTRSRTDINHFGGLYSKSYESRLDERGQRMDKTSTGRRVGLYESRYKLDSEGRLQSRSRSFGFLASKTVDYEDDTGLKNVKVKILGVKVRDLEKRHNSGRGNDDTWSSTGSTATSGFSGRTLGRNAFPHPSLADRRSDTLASNRSDFSSASRRTFNVPPPRNGAAELPTGGPTGLRHSRIPVLKRKDFGPAYLADFERPGFQQSLPPKGIEGGDRNARPEPTQEELEKMLPRQRDAYAPPGKGTPPEYMNAVLRAKGMPGISAEGAARLNMPASAPTYAPHDPPVPPRRNASEQLKTEQPPERPPKLIDTQSREPSAFAPAYARIENNVYRDTKLIEKEQPNSDFVKKMKAGDASVDIVFSNKKGDLLMTASYMESKAPLKTVLDQRTKETGIDSAVGKRAFKGEKPQILIDTRDGRLLGQDHPEIVAARGDKSLVEAFGEKRVLVQRGTTKSIANGALDENSNDSASVRALKQKIREEVNRPGSAEIEREGKPADADSDRRRKTDTGKAAKTETSKASDDDLSPEELAFLGSGYSSSDNHRKDCGKTDQAKDGYESDSNDDGPVEDTPRPGRGKTLPTQIANDTTLDARPQRGRA